MRKIFLLRGAPGSGKSSFIARHHLQPYAISRDEIRLLLADLTVYYEESTDHLHQVIPRHVTVRTEQMVDNLVQHFYDILGFFYAVTEVFRTSVTICDKRIIH